MIAASIADARVAVQSLADDIRENGRQVVGIVGLFSGGNDSTVLCHMLRGELTHLAHCNTGIGVEQTRQYVRDRAADWSLPLLEFHPPQGSTYRELVLERGFPGPGQHYKMYQRLKERSLRQVRGALITDSYKQRVIFVAGRRRAESARRANVPERDTTGSIEWISPLVEWTDEMMAHYRRVFDVPRNEVSDSLHMSGECLCGAFTTKGELEEIGFFFPDVALEIRSLEAEVRAAGIPEPQCRWGWGADRARIELEGQQAFEFGPLCSSCEYRAENAA